MYQTENLVALVLAAGEGTRMKSDTPKVLHELCGYPMLFYILDAVSSLKPTKTVVVVGHRAQQVRDAVLTGWAERTGRHVEFAVQAEQLGTAHAVICALDFMRDDETVLILCGDTPLVTADLLSEFLGSHQHEDADLTVMTAMASDPGSYGRILRGSNGSVLRIVEARDLTEEQKSIPEINAGIYLTRARHLKTLLARVNNDNAKKEYYLTDIVELANRDGLKVRAFACHDEQIVQGINDRWALSQAENRVRLGILRELALNGVTIRDPGHTYVERTVVIGRDSILEPGTVLRGNTRIGSRCVIGPETEIIDSIIGDGSRIWRSVVESSVIYEDVHVGPYAHLRPNTTLHKGVYVGNYAEIKNSVIGAGSKVHHHSYLGDSDVGSNVNIGAGTVTVNYDGVRKHRTTIRDNAFLGCNSNLIAPVTIGKDAYVAAGSTITEDVPDDALAIARERQTNKEGWVSKRRQQQTGR